MNQSMKTVNIVTCQSCGNFGPNPYFHFCSSQKDVIRTIAPSNLELLDQSNEDLKDTFRKVIKVLEEKLVLVQAENQKFREALNNIQSCVNDQAEDESLRNYLKMNNIIDFIMKFILPPIAIILSLIALWMNHR